MLFRSGTLWNTYAFYVLYADIDEFDPTEHELDFNKLCVMDKWLLSKLNSMVKSVDENLENYRIPEACKSLQEFVDDMSNWYVRRCRERYWKQNLDDDKIDAYMTLYTALVTVAKAAAPMIPFMAEQIYQNLVCTVDKTAPESIHLCAFPEVDEDCIDVELEKNMDEVLNIVGLGRAARNGANIKNRQPLGAMYVKADIKLDGYYADIIRDELNVKTVNFVDEADELMSYNFKPQLKTLGPKYGKNLGEIRTLLSEIDAAKAKKELDSNGSIKLNISIGEIELTAEDLLIETVQREGLFSVSDFGVTVAIDTTLTDELIEEGFVREIISKVQTMRKDADFNVTDHINITVKGNDNIVKIIENNKDEIFTAVLADGITVGEPDGYSADWNINGEKVTLGVTKVQ